MIDVRMYQLPFHLNNSNKLASFEFQSGIIILTGKFNEHSTPDRSLPEFFFQIYFMHLSFWPELYTAYMCACVCEIQMEIRNVQTTDKEKEENVFYIAIIFAICSLSQG